MDQFLYPRKGIREVLDPFEKTVWLEEITDFGCAPIVIEGYQPPPGYRLKDIQHFTQISDCSGNTTNAEDERG